VHAPAHRIGAIVAPAVDAGELLELLLELWKRLAMPPSVVVERGRRTRCAPPRRERSPARRACSSLFRATGFTLMVTPISPATVAMIVSTISPPLFTSHDELAQPNST
jgi:hypothetical protein